MKENKEIASFKTAWLTQTVAIAQVLEVIKNEDIAGVIELMKHCQGKYVFTGMGKAGHVAKKVASTFSSLGMPSVYLHPGEASHGDLGILDPRDTVIAFSNSGKTREVVEATAQIRNLHGNVVPILGIVGSNPSPLSEVSDISIKYGDVIEACHLGLAPTSSTTIMQMIGDCMAVALAKSNGFTKAQYGKRHHGGYLGILANA